MKIINLGISSDYFEWLCPISVEAIISDDGFNPSYVTSFILHDNSESFEFLNDENLALWEKVCENHELGKYSSFKNEIFLNTIWEKYDHKISVYQLDDPDFSGNSSWIGITGTSL